MSFDRNFDKWSLAGRQRERRGQEMKMPILARLVAAGAMLAAAAGAAAAQAPKPWKHGIIAPKADAGFLLMAAKRGFAEREGLKLELLEVKDDQIGLKALLAGELDSYEGGVQGAIAAGVRGGDVKIMGSTGSSSRTASWSRPASTRWKISRASPSPCPRPARSPTCWRAWPWRNSRSPPPTSALRRLAAIATATPHCSAGWSTPRWCRTSICRWRRRRI